jgi:protein-S-isoprenylcysteine O-methyltransferase Ste14
LNPTNLRSLTRYLAIALLLAAILFLVSGRPDWSRAWLYIGLAVGSQVVVGIVLSRIAPDLLAERSRMQAGTKGWDKILAPAVALVGPIAFWSVAAWDVRHHWPPVVPVWASAAAFFVCLLGSALIFWAMVTNRFFSATVRIQDDRGHVVVDGGPYRYVRHPGYVGAFAFTLASPVALGSWIALVPATIVAALLVVRTALEDRTLCRDLAGYREFTRRTRSRLFPGLW